MPMTSQQRWAQLTEARRYVRNLVAASPRQVAAGVDVIDAHDFGDSVTPPSGQTLVLDLSDGTSIRLDITRYRR